MQKNMEECWKTEADCMEELGEWVKSTLAGEIDPLEYIEERLISMRELGEHWRESKIIYDRMDGVARVFVANVPNGNYDMRVFIGREVLDRWDITEEKLREAAIQNRRKKKLIVRPIIEMVNEAAEMVGLAGLEPTESNRKCVVVTCERSNGAAQILRPEAQKKVREMLGDDFIIIFCSGEEAICADVTGMTKEDIREFIWSADMECGKVALDLEPYVFDSKGVLRRM